MCQTIDTKLTTDKQRRPQKYRGSPLKPVRRREYLSIYPSVQLTIKFFRLSSVLIRMPSGYSRALPLSVSLHPSVPGRRQRALFDCWSRTSLLQVASRLALLFFS